MEKSYNEHRLVDLPKICDVRGNLSIIENSSNVPFQIARVYWIYDVPGGKVRHGHAFRRQDEFIVALSGSFNVVLNDGVDNFEYHLCRSHYGVYVPHGTWRELNNFSTNAVALVISSEYYDEGDYIEDFNEFKTYKMSLSNHE